MNLLDYFKTNRPKSASIAKERLQILVAHERRAERTPPAYLADLQKELLAVVRKYVQVSADAISVNMDQDENSEVLELNIVLPDESPTPPRRRKL
jgi:cell division topological specificity factor